MATKFVTISATLLVAAGVAACGGSSHNTKTRTAKTAAATVTTISGPTLTATQVVPNAKTIWAGMNRLYSTHPELAKYIVQGTTYTTKSRTLVFDECTSSGPAATSADVETTRVDACAPMIFFFYNYGASHRVAAATKLADDLFAFASTNIPESDGGTQIATLLRQWGVKVGTVPTPDDLTPPQVALLDRIDRAIEARGAVRVTIRGYKQNGDLAERIVEDIDQQTAQETIDEPTAHATLALTPQAAYLSGDTSGLTNLVGLAKTAAKKAHGRWVEIPKTDQQYLDLKAEDTLGSLPSTILPDKTDTVKLSAGQQSSDAVDVLQWRAPTGTTNQMLTERLEVTRGSHPIPIQETTTVGGYREVVSFSRWGKPVAVSTPSGRVVEYSAITDG